MGGGSGRGKRRAVSLMLVLLLAHLLLLLLLLLLLRPDNLPPASDSATAAAATAAAPSAASPTRLLGNPRARESPCVGVGTGKTWAWQPVYTVVIDAGDTATRTHVFSFLRCCLDNTFLLQKEHYFQVNDTVLNYVTAPHQMRWLLLPLLRRARSVVPEPYLPYTPLLLRATPSLRRLPRPYASRLIYRARKIVSRTSFLVKREEVTIMAGHDEAADLWLAANFLTGRLYQNDSLPMATANLGGGTLQVTIPLPGQPEHITRAINQRRKGGGGEVSQSGDGRSKEHPTGGGRTGSNANLRGKHDAEGLDLLAAAKNSRRRKTSDKETTDNRNSGGGGGGGASGSVGDTRTRGRGRDGMRVSHRVFAESQSQSQHVQKGSLSPSSPTTAATGLGDTSTNLQGSQGLNSTETPKQVPRRRNYRKRFRGSGMKPRHRKVNLGNHMNNSVVDIPQNANNRPGERWKKLRKENSKQNQVFRSQDTRSEEDSGRPIATGRNIKVNMTMGREESLHESRGSEKSRKQVKKSENIHTQRFNNRRKNSRHEEENKDENRRNEQTEGKHRHGQQEGRIPHEEDTKDSTRNFTRTQKSSQRQPVILETQRTKNTTTSTQNHTSNADTHVTPGRSRKTGRRVNLPASRSHRLQPPQRRKHPRRHRQRNQKKPTRRKGGSIDSNSTLNGQENIQENLPRQRQSSSSSSAVEQRIDGGSGRENPDPTEVGTSLLPRRVPHNDHVHRHNHTTTDLTPTTDSTGQQRHDHRSALNKRQRRISMTRRRNTKNRNGGQISVNSDSNTTQNARVSKSSSSEVTDNSFPDNTVNESLANGRGEIDKRGEEVGGRGAGEAMTSHPGREINEKVRKIGHNTTLEVNQDKQKTSTTANGKYLKRRRWRKRKFRAGRRRKAWSLRRKRLQQRINLSYNTQNTTQRGIPASPVPGVSQSDNTHDTNKTRSVEESPRRRRTHRQKARRVSGGGMTDFPLPQISGNSQDNNKSRQRTTSLSRQLGPSFRGSQAQTGPAATASDPPRSKNKFLSIVQRDRKRQRDSTTSALPDVTTSKSLLSSRVIAHDTENQSRDTHQRNNSGDLQTPQAQTPHRLRHNHRGRRRHRRRHHHRRRHRYQRKEDGRGRRSAEEVRHNTFYGLNRLLPPDEEKKSAVWRKNDQNHRRELADPFLVASDWRDSLRKSYFGTLFLWPNIRERWQRLSPRRDVKKSSESEAEDFWFNDGSGRAVDTLLGTEIRGSSREESQKASYFLRRRRSVSKLAWETKAKVKAKRQNLLVALSQRCGRTGAGLLRSCGEPEIKCQPGEGGTSQAEMGHGKCDHLNLGGNQSSLAEQESPAGKDLIPKRYPQQNGDTALVRVTDGRGREGGGYQRRRRELRNLPETPNITYRCSPSHKYWLFASSMPMGLYPLRVKILQSGNITRAVPTSEDDSRPRRPTSETAPTTQSPPISVTQHHRSDIPPEEEYIGIDEVEDSSQYPGKLFTPSTIPQTHPTTAVPPSLPSTTQQPPPPARPPYTTVRVTNKWVEETLAKVKTVVDSILKSIGSARSNVEEKSSKNPPDLVEVNKNKEGKEERAERRKSVKGERDERRRSKGEEREKEKGGNSEKQKKARDNRERGTRREGIEMGGLGKKRSRERNRKGKSEGNRRRRERLESQITLESSEDQEADGREGERNGRGENTESLRNEHNNRERRKHGRRRNAVRKKAKNNVSSFNRGGGGDESEFSNSKVSQELGKVPGVRKDKLGGAASSPPSRVSKVLGAEDESVSGAHGETKRERDTATTRNEESNIESERLPIPLSVVSQSENVKRSESNSHLRNESETIIGGEGTNDSSDSNVRTELPIISLPGDNETGVEFGDKHGVNLGTATSVPLKTSSKVDSGKNDNNASGSNDAPASKQTISSVTDLLFTVPNERVIRPAQNSKVQSEIKSTEKLIRTSLEGLLFRVPPGGPSSTTKQSQEVKSRFRASGGDVVTPTTTTASPDATTPHPEVTSPEDPPTGVDVKTIVTESEPAHRRSHERGKKIPGAEAPHDTNNQRLNATENGSREPESAEEEEEEEEGDLILRTACLPVGSIGRFKVEGVTYLVTGIGAGPGAEDCRREVTNVVNRHIRLPALNHTTLLATTAFYFVAASANLIEPEMTYGFVRVEQFRLAANIMCAKEPRLLPDPLACLDYQYIAALLTQGLHLSDDSEVLVCDKIQGFRVSWALGAALDYLQNH